MDYGLEAGDLGRLAGLSPPQNFPADLSRLLHRVSNLTTLAYDISLAINGAEKLESLLESLCQPLRTQRHVPA